MIKISGKIFITVILSVFAIGFMLIPVLAADADHMVTMEFTEIEEGEAGIYEDSDSLLSQYTGFGDVNTLSIDALYASSYNAYKLSGLTYTVYEQVKYLASQVAGGWTNDTRLNVTFTEDQLTDYTWTAGDLGVSSLYGDDTESTVNADAAKTAIDSVLNPTLAIKSAIRDCPYELYWFSNKYTISKKYTPYVRMSSETGEIIMGLKSVTVSISMGVSPDFQAPDSEDGYTTDDSKLSSIQSAMQNAREIINAAYGMSDWEKLDFFRQRICELATYDYYVSAATYPGGYGNPWQLIYVFDSDPETKVVCEGYTKAFQYLCDESGMSYGTYVYNVSGDFQIGNGGTQGHLWNIVCMNGVNYLVDLTNCDGDTLSTDLFMALPAGGSVDYGYSFYKGDVVYTYYYSSDARMIYYNWELAMYPDSGTGGDDDTIVLNRVLYAGLYGDDVKAVQQRLYDLGYLSVVPDGVYGWYTQDAVNRFQIANGLGYCDGMVGNWTVGKLNSDPVPADTATPADNTVPEDTPEDDQTITLSRVLSYGMTGDDVKAVQQRLYDLGYLNVVPDGVYGWYTQDAVNRFQIANGLGYSDGMVGNWTVGKLNGDAAYEQTGDNSESSEYNSPVEAEYTRQLYYGLSGDDVKAMQERLSELGFLQAVPDGIFGGYTQEALISFQEYYGLYGDGIAGPRTWELLFG